jgi:DNA-binding NarL/FixJ family response regulator
MSVPRLLIADDHRVFAQALARLLGDSYAIVGTFPDGRALVEGARELQPDLILLDMSMPLLNGIETLRQLRKVAARARVIFLSMHREPSLVATAFREGARGFMLKTAPAADILRAIRAVLEGAAYVDPELPESLRQDILSGRGRSESRSPLELTAREREVVQLIAEGHCTKEIAALLHRARKTIEFHKYNAMRKSRSRTTADLTRFAVRTGIAGL